MKNIGLILCLIIGVVSAREINFDALEKKTQNKQSISMDFSDASESNDKKFQKINTGQRKAVNKFVSSIAESSSSMSSIKKSCLAQTEYGSSYCHGIKDEDIKKSCLAQTEYGSSYCHGIKDEDIKKSCLAQTEYGSSHCHGIKDKDIKTSCLAQTEYGSSHCYGIGNEDMKKSCVAQTKHNSSLCY